LCAQIHRGKRNAPAKSTGLRWILQEELTMTARKSGQQVAVDSIITALEAGTIPWRKPWTSRMPRNLVSQKTYRGMNVFYLALQGFPSEHWLTFNQAKSLGGYVMAGQHGTLITKYSVFGKHEVDENGDESVSRRGFFRTYTVFNLTQCNPELATALGLANTEPLEDIPAAQAIWDNYKSRPTYKDADCAYYRPSEDLIGMPPRSKFTSQAEYYSTLFHEMTHSTGHLSRLNREGITQTTQFGSEDYSNEELVAEFGASMLCGQCGIAPALVQNQAAYIQNWLTKLKLQDNRTLLSKAMSAAQKAVDYILGEQAASVPIPEQASELAAA
jgi:antirestriction protein ArdC